MSDTSYMVPIVLFLVAVGFLNLYVPAQYQFMSSYSLVTLGGTTAGVGAACVIATGAACAVAIGASIILNVLVAALTSTNAIVSALIVAPLTFIITWLILKLATEANR